LFLLHPYRHDTFPEHRIQVDGPIPNVEEMRGNVGEPHPQITDRNPPPLDAHRPVLDAHVLLAADLVQVEVLVRNLDVVLGHALRGERSGLLRLALAPLGLFARLRLACTLGFRLRAP